MTDIRDHVVAIKNVLAGFTRYETLLVITRSPEADSDRLEVHVLDVASNDSFQVMESTVQRLMDAFGELPWLVFAHSLAASTAVRSRFAGRAESILPRQPSAARPEAVHEASGRWPSTWLTTQWESGAGMLRTTFTTEDLSVWRRLMRVVPPAHDWAYRSVEGASLDGFYAWTGVGSQVSGLHVSAELASQVGLLGTAA